MNETIAIAIVVAFLRKYSTQSRQIQTQFKQFSQALWTLLPVKTVVICGKMVSMYLCTLHTICVSNGINGEIDRILFFISMLHCLCFCCKLNRWIAEVPFHSYECCWNFWCVFWHAWIGQYSIFKPSTLTSRMHCFNNSLALFHNDSSQLNHFT